MTFINKNEIYKNIFNTLNINNSNYENEQTKIRCKFIMDMLIFLTKEQRTQIEVSLQIFEASLPT